MGVGPCRLKAIRSPAPDELVSNLIRYLFEVIHCIQERRHIWMAKSVPCRSLLAEVLRGPASGG